MWIQGRDVPWKNTYKKLEEKREEDKHQNGNRNPWKVFEQVFKVRLLSQQNEWKLDIKMYEICLEQSLKKCLEGNVFSYPSRITVILQ